MSARGLPYEENASPREIAAWQLARFNVRWGEIQERVPFYRELRRKEAVPAEFRSWSEFREQMPVLDKRMLQQRRADLVDPARPPDAWRSTGGSTAAPVQIPVWGSEAKLAGLDAWAARRWLGIDPADRLFLLWGHSHLLGSGWQGRVNRIRRQLGDRLLGYRRWSAYDLSEARLREAGEALLRFRPAYVLGYAAALDRFARANLAIRDVLRGLRLKVVLATGESFPRADSREWIGDLFGAPVVMEYGAVETGPLAQERPGLGFRVLWRSHVIEGREVAGLEDAREILVTSLEPRALPLIRYALGDAIRGEPAAEGIFHTIEAVVGRRNDCVVLRNGAVTHSEAFAHALRDVGALTDFQVVQRRDGTIEILYAAARDLDESEEGGIRRRLALVSAELGSVALRRTERPEQTIAGKIRRVLREDGEDRGPHV